MKFVCFSGWDQLPDSANTLFRQAENESIFFSRSWFERLTTTTLEQDQTIALACVVAEDDVMAILPLVMCTGNTWYSLKHRYTPIYSLLLVADGQQRVLDCLAQGLSQLPLKALLLEPVADNDNAMSGLQQAMQSAGFHCDVLFRHYNWIYRTQGQSYKDYIAARPARLRNTIARKRRKLEREQGYNIRLYTGNDVPHAMADYHAVYRASWKATEQYSDFLGKLVTDFSMQGWTRLAVLYIKGQPAAAQLWFVHHGNASIFRLAYDEVWRRYSPGSILTSFLMQYVIDTDQVKVIDFLYGNDAYKQDWMSERRDRLALSCVKSVKSANRYKRFIDSMKHMLKRRFLPQKPQYPL